MNAHRWTYALAAFACASCGASLALADVKTFDDPKDAQGPVDIKEVRAGHDPKGRLVHRIETYGKMDSGEEPGVNVYAGEFDEGDSHYQVSSFGVTNGRGEKTGRVKMKRPDNKTVVYKFRKGAIDNVPVYKWQACVCLEGEEQDLAPDRKKRHQIGQLN